MRAALCVLIALVAGCAAQNELAAVPPPGVDLSGHWRLNVADSDDPLRLAQAMAAGVGAGSPGQDSGGGQRGGRGSRGSRQNGQPPIVQQQPIVIPTTIVADLLRWPGAEVDASQQGGAVTLNSDGDSRVYRPLTGPGSGGERGARRGRRSSGPPVCGWSGASLIVKVDPQGDQPGFDARYRLSDDGTRLLQFITLRGGRADGFTLSRVWDRE